MSAANPLAGAILRALPEAFVRDVPSSQGAAYFIWNGLQFKVETDLIVSEIVGFGLRSTPCALLIRRLLRLTAEATSAPPAKTPKETQP